MLSAAPPRAATIRPGGKLLVWSANEASGARLMQEARRGGFDAAYVGNLTEVRNRLTQDNIAVCVLDEPSSIQTVRDLANACTAVSKVVQFVVLPPVGAAYIDAPNAPDCCDVLRPPMSVDKLAGALFRAAARASIIEAPEAPQQAATPAFHDPITGHSPVAAALRERVREVAQTHSPVLICGPRGSGVSVAARAIHNRQFGCEAPFVVVRCAVLTGGALEQELFGDAPINAAIEGGLWAAAANGTLMLDDVDQVPLSMQSRLVKLLATQILRNSRLPEGTPPGGPRIIASTHVDLEERVRDGRFDPELYRIIKQARVETSPLSRRIEDLVPIAAEILTEISQYDGRPHCRLTADAVELLRRHPWTENIRELKNVLNRACSLFIGGEVTAEMLRPWLENSLQESVEEPGLTLAEMERKLIEATFNRYAGNREMTAKALQIGLRTLSGKLREYGYPPRGGPGSNRIRRAA
jgi:DNA-binding NtrC family response regulator